MRDYLTEMLYALTSAYSNKDYENVKRGSPPETNIGKLFSLLAWGFRIVEENAEKIRSWDNIDNACGSVLDRYGRNFGVERMGTSDEFYRLAIRVKVMSQLSGGDPDTVLNAAAELLDVNVSDILLEEVYPAKIALYVDQKLLSKGRLDLIDLIAGLIKRILAAGVGLRLYLRTYHTFRFETIIGFGVITETHFSSAPLTEDRYAREDLKIGVSGFIGIGGSSEVIGENRLVRNPMVFGFAGQTGFDADSGLLGENRQASESAKVSFGGFSDKSVSSGMYAGIKKSHTTPVDDSGGAFCHTHVTSKLIE